MTSTEHRPTGAGTRAGSLPGPLVDVDRLAALAGRPGTVILDASVGAHRSVGRRIPGARRFDIDGAMSDHSVRLPHTMPPAEWFAEEMRALGVNSTDTVVVYDTAGIYSSPRAWWMLRAMGFDRAAVLDGGLPAWEAAGHPVEDLAPEGRAEEPRAAGRGGSPAQGPSAEAPGTQGPWRAGDFTARPRPGSLVGSDVVLAALADPDAAVLDARSRERFAGTAAEPRPGLRGGHMPGSVSLPFGVLQRDGRMLPEEQLRSLFEASAGDRERLVVSCGSGVTACVLALGAELAGYSDVAVYDGSWSEWGLPSELPVVTGP
ncbi:sulfurtransferase [[Kitasatospora] papulosa]|uniref:sulfurtransferase n=1 Tax=Streptomyces TaxID=1883 RepID=UPI0005268602|nr:sulfurtransferase [Streptomyces sp. SNU607]MBD2832586.1 sulfurtransferase [Streptomyces pratensis]TPN30536.1 sulfurtransferase [Mesorhizobium sp. B2-3-3]WKV79333.1 sulfurtransferase [Streptomyces sp. SNU607]